MTAALNISAYEARLLAEDAFENTLQFIFNKIYEACLKGHTVITCDANITLEIMHVLEAHGYEVYYDDDDEGGFNKFWVVKWNNATKGD